MKRFFWFLLILSLCVFAEAVPGKAAGNSPAIPQDIQLADDDGDEEPVNIDEGVYDDVPWCVTSDYVLEIGKKDEEYTYVSMRSRYASNYPWHKFRSQITEVRFPGLVHGAGDMGEMFRDCTQITTVDLTNFDTSQVSRMNGLFRGCTNLQTMDMSGIDMTSMNMVNTWFYGCSSLTDVNMKGLDISKVTNLGSLFTNCSSLESIDLSGWDTSNVTVMGVIFGGCTNLKDVNLAGWDTSKSTTFQEMFYGCESLETLDVSGFNTVSADNMDKMFKDCKNLKSLDLSGFYMPEATNLDSMFQNCAALTSLDLSAFKPCKAWSLDFTFSGCTNLKTLDLTGFTTPEAFSMQMTFWDCSSLESLDLGDFDVSNVGNMRCMFLGCKSLGTLNISSFKTTKATNMINMFDGCESLKKLDLSGFTTSNVEYMASMFSDCSSLESIDVTGFDMGNVKYISNMFRDLTVETIDVSGWDTSKVMDMGGLFSGCKNLKALDLSGFNTENVTDMGSMFYNCESLTFLDLSSFNTAKVEEMDWMVKGCKNLKTLDISSFDMSNVTDLKRMLYGLDSIEVLKLGSGVKLAGSELSSNKFYWSADDIKVFGPMEFEETYNAEMAGTYHRYIFGDFADCVVTLYPTSFVYNPQISQYTPEVTVTLNGEKLAYGTDYKQVWENNKVPGIASVTIIPSDGRFIGQKKVTYEIKKQPNDITTSSTSYSKTGKASAQSFSLGTVQLGDGALTFRSSSSSVKVSTAGKVTISKNFVGKATITITAAESEYFEGATKKVTITVNPPKVTLLGLTNPAAKKMKVTWKKSAVTSITGYEIQYATNKAFTKNKKSVKVKGASKTAYTVSKLTKGKTYYVRIRGYKTVSGKTYSSSWSAVKSVKIKK